MTLDSVVTFLDGLLGAPLPDYPNALNGLQVENSGTVSRVAVAVDASEATIRAAGLEGADLLIVHHGLFWDGPGPLTGRHFRRVSALLRHDLAVYSSHLPLDAHPEVGNGILLSRALEVEVTDRFGEARGVEIGWRGTVPPEDRRSFQARIAAAVDGPVRLLPGGPDVVEKVAVVTGGGGSLIEAAAEAGVDTFVTGEASHPAFLLAMELGVNVFLAGHYATETFGVKALGAALEQHFDLPWSFVHVPSGL